LSIYIDGIRLHSHLDQQAALEDLLRIAAEVHCANVTGRCHSYLRLRAREGLTREGLWDSVRRIPIIQQNSGVLLVAEVDGRTYISFTHPLSGLRQAAENLGEDYSYTDAVSADTPEEAAEMAERARIWDEVERSGKDIRFSAEPIVATLIDDVLRVS